METATEILVNAGVVTGLLEAVKRAVGPRFDWERFGALTAIGVGVLTAEAGVALNWFTEDTDYGSAALFGVIAGLAASGLYHTARQATHIR